MTKAALEASIANLDTLIQVFAVLVAIGIVGEVGFGVRHWVLNRRLIAIQHTEDLNQEQAIATFNKEAGVARRDAAAAIERAAKAEENLGAARKEAATASERAALAEQHSAEANAKAEGFRLDIAKANETAERERLARLQLEARLADRTLTPIQQSILVAALSSSPRIVIDVATFGDTAEISGISRLIIESLVRAGWTVHPVTAMAGQATVRGILIGTRTGSDPAISQASALLIKSLRAQNLSADPWVFEQMTWPGAFMGGGGVKYDAPIRMFIGSKP